MIKILPQSTLCLTLWRGLLVFVLMLFFGVCKGQTNIWNGSVSSNWNTASNWSLNLVPTAAHDVVFETNASILVNVTTTINSLIIRNNAEVIFTSSGGARTITIDNTSSRIDSGSTLILQGSTGSGTRSMGILFSGSNRTMDISGILDLTSIGEGTSYNATNSVTIVSGTLRRTGGGGTVGTITSTTSNLIFEQGGNYSHEVNGSVVPTASWNINSTVSISGTTSTDPTGLNQSFGNFIWNATGLGSNSVNFNPTGIAGDLEINNGSATGQIIQTVGSISIGGDLIVGGGVFAITSGNNATRVISVSGNVTISGGALIVKQSNNGAGTLNINGNLSHTGGTITRSGSGGASINFSGSGSPQLFTSGGTVTNSIDWTVNSGAFLQMAASGTTVTGDGTFTLSSGATLGITSPDGITTAGATGNIQVLGTRSFSTGANYVYNGNVNQAVGNGLPGTVNSLIIANTGSIGNNLVTLDADKIISSELGVELGVLDLVGFTANRATLGGTFYLEANTGLRLNGVTNFPSNFSTRTLDCTSTVEYYANGPQTVAAVNYGNLLLSGSGVKTLQAGTTQLCSNFTLSGIATTTAVVGMTVGGDFTIGSGTSFTAGAFTHQVNGNWSNQGTFTAGSSTFSFAGTIPGALSNTGTGDFFNLAFAGSGTKTINSPLSPTGDISQISTSVVLSGVNTITLAAGRSLEINASGSVTTGSGRLIIQPGASYVNRSTSNPTLEVRQQFTGNKGWRLLGTPINSTYEALTSGFETQGFPGSTNPTLQPNLLWWDETDKGTTLQGWRQPASLSAAVPAGRGHYFYVFNGESKLGGGNYADALPITMSVTGTEVNLASGNFDFGVTFTQRDTSLIAQGDSLIEVNQADEGFNLVANPTASVIDFHAATGWTKTNIDQSIYVWDPATASFLTWNGTAGSLGSGRIAPFQAFWVKANAASPLLRLNGNGPKSLLTTDFFGRKLAEPTSILELNVIGEGMSAQSIISFGDEGETGADPKDAYQLESLGEDWLLLYSFGSLRTKSPLVINHQPSLSEQEDRVIPLHLASAKKGEPFKGAFLMDWKVPANWDSSLDLVLMDHINQKAIDMKKESAYAFEFEAPKSTNFNSRKGVESSLVPRAVVFQTPYSLDAKEIPSNARVSADSKPKRPFTLFIGKFPEGRIEYLPDFPKLFSPAPNPFVDQTKIRFFLPVAEEAEVNIYSLLGQEVGGFPKQEYSSGIHELDWMPQGMSLPKGIYLIRLLTPTGQFTQKLIKN